MTGSTTTVGTGGTLGGTGTVGLVTINDGGTLAPGNDGIGTLTTFALTFQTNATLRLEIGATTGDQARVAAGANLAGLMPLSITLTADPTDSTVFTIVDGNVPVNGYAAGARFTYNGNALDEGETFQVSDGPLSQFFNISYTADAGRDITLVAIPEPSALSAVAVGALALAGLRRRRRLQ
jgi:hypothetical protein